MSHNVSLPGCDEDKDRLEEIGGIGRWNQPTVIKKRKQERQALSLFSY